MIEVKISTLGTELVLPADSLTNGTTTAAVHFIFDETWAGYEPKIAVFSNETQTAQAEINSEGIAVIPPVILATLWRFVSVGVNAEDNGAYSPFIRIGQVLPSGKNGQDGKFVTIEQLQNILLDYVKAEDLGIYATKEELASAIDAQATGIEMLSRAVGANTTAIVNNAEEIATKADKTELAGYWSKADIGLQTSGDGTKYLADDGTYKLPAGGDAKAFIAEYNVTTAQEIIDFIDASNEPYAPMQVKRGGSYYTVVTAVKQGADQVIIRTFGTLSGNYYMFTYTITGNTWASSSYGFQKLLESGTNIKTINGQSILGSGDIPIDAAAQVQADWDETNDAAPAYIKNKPAIPDISGLATKTELQTAQDNLQAAVDEKADKTTVVTLSETVAANTAAIATKADKTALEAAQADIAGKADSADVSALAARVGDAEAGIQVNTAGILENTQNITNLQNTVAAKADRADIPDVSNFVTEQQLITGLASKADRSELSDYARKSELPDISDMATQTWVRQYIASLDGTNMQF